MSARSLLSKRCIVSLNKQIPVSTPRFSPLQISCRLQSTSSVQYKKNVQFTTTGNQSNKNNDNVNGIKKFLIFAGFFGIGWFVTQHFTFMDLIAMYRYDKLPETDAKVVEYKTQLKLKLLNLPILKQLEDHGYMKTYDSSSSHNLIDETLNVPGGIFIDPEFYYNPKENKSCGVYHLGMKLTGYPFIVHGGVLATVMEDMMTKALKFEVANGSLSSEGPKSKEHISKLNKISLKYKFPTFANQFVVLRSTSLKKINKNTYEIEIELLDQSGKHALVNGKGKFTIN